MADITKCSGEGCPIKTLCYRFTAVNGSWQSYFDKPPFKEGYCDMFWGEASKQLMDELDKIVNGK